MGKTEKREADLIERPNRASNRERRRDSETGKTRKKKKIQEQRELRRRCRMPDYGAGNKGGRSEKGSAAHGREDLAAHKPRMCNKKRARESGRVYEYDAAVLLQLQRFSSISPCL